jgi:hypothetical protein
MLGIGSIDIGSIPAQYRGPTHTHIYTVDHYTHIFTWCALILCLRNSYHRRENPV